MLNYSQVSIALIIIWGVAFYLLKRRLHSLKGYFALLFLMAVAGIVLPLDKIMDIGFEPSFSLIYTILFAVLLLSAIIPWLYFDKYLQKIAEFKVNKECLPLIRKVIIMLTLLSLFAIAYVLPYAIKAYMIGGSDVRSMIKDQSLLPVSPFTTISVGIGLITPVYVLLFYLSLLTSELHKYSKFLFLGSLTYLFTSAAFQARDGFVYIPLTYFFLYIVFKNSLSESSKKLMKKMFSITLPVLLGGILIISIDRFYEKGANDAFQSLLDGTWGYFYQQPYVFDMTLQHMKLFQGIGHRFEFIGQVFNMEYSTDYVPNYEFEWMFGTMYASFYSAKGWSSLLIAALFFSVSWLVVLRRLITSGNHMGALLVFSLYLYYLVSGLFYFRFSAMNITLVYIGLILLSFLLRRYISVIYRQ